MKGVFGLLLIAGGIVLVYGLFTGKITFPTTGSTGLPNPVNVAPGPGGTLLPPNIKVLNPDGSCPSGYTKVATASGQQICKKNGT